MNLPMDDSEQKRSTSDPSFENSVRYGSGVPQELRSTDLAYIEMTGISRRATIAEVAEVPRSPTPSFGLPIAYTPMQVDRVLQELIGELSPVIDPDAEAASASKKVPARPPGATQALAEAEVLLQALTRR